VIVEEALHGWGEPLSSVAPRGTLGHNEDLVAYPEDVGRSRELLREAGHDEGFSLKVMASEVAPTPQVVAVLKEQLGRIGVALEVNTYTRRELLEKVVYPKLMGVSKPSEFDMWVVAGWPSIFGAGAYFDFLFLHSRGMYNVGVYSGKESQVDKIYERAMRALDEKEMKTHLRELDRYVHEQSLAIPLYQSVTVYGMRKGVKFEPTLSDFPHRFRQAAVLPVQGDHGTNR
jgi:ABC-type transport system substrate-binding protein